MTFGRTLLSDSLGMTLYGDYGPFMSFFNSALFDSFVLVLDTFWTERSLLVWPPTAHHSHSETLDIDWKPFHSTIQMHVLYSNCEKAKAKNDKKTYKIVVLLCVWGVAMQRQAHIGRSGERSDGAAGKAWAYPRTRSMYQIVTNVDWSRHLIFLVPV